MTTFTMLAALAALSAAPDAVLLQFASETCGPCRDMQPAISRLVADGYPVQRIDVDKHPEIAQQFNVRGVPAFVLVAGNQEVDRIVGPTSYDRLAQIFAQVQRPAAAPVAASSPATISQAALQPTEYRGQSSPEEAARAALAASVRLKVEDATGHGYGTGTIIDVHGDEALVVTCGHLFRESQGKGRITVDLFVPGASQPVEGQLIAYDLQRDIALVSIRPSMPLKAAQVAPPGLSVRPRDPVFSIGCDKGAAASVRTSEITAVNKYRGRPNFTAKGAPIDGRSGGGLFTAEGLLIGICNAADPADDEGLYAGLASIHWQLDQIGQSEIYQRAARDTQVAAVSELPTASVPVQPVGFSKSMETPPLATAPNLPAQMPAVAEMTTLPASGPGAGDDTELVVIVRSKRDPSQRSEIYVVDRATPELLTNIVHAARRGAEDRAAAVATAQRQRASQPVVRGQFTP